jgi:hypothetical protein
MTGILLDNQMEESFAFTEQVEDKFRKTADMAKLDQRSKTPLMQSD